MTKTKMKPKYQGRRLNNDNDEARKIEEDKRAKRAAQNAAGSVTNAVVSVDPIFVAACGRAGIKPTTRQASKWRNKRGLAWEHRSE